MCVNIPLSQKAQPIAGLEKGWHFAFCEPKLKGKEESDDSLHGLVLLSPSGHSFRSLENVLYSCGQDWQDWDKIRDAFYSQIGSSTLRKENHFLVGRRYCQEWTDILGQNKIVYGTVTECERNDMDNSFYQFTVIFDNRSRELVNTVRNICGTSLPEFTKLSLAWTLGGCFNFDQKVKNRAGSASMYNGVDTALISKYWSWITPEMRTEELIPLVVGGTPLPQLTMIVRGFRLMFLAKKSGIPNAGYGVFVKCSSFTGDSTFVLTPGEILDIGIYAPFRRDDRKHAAVFLLKNYIHNLKCEEWAFDTTDSSYQFDITEDNTGNLHELAKSHIPAYVNECGPDSIATVKAEHDPEGNVHYLLGVADGSTSFSLPANDSEREIFINYGLDYEHVRVRKGYSTLPPDELAQQQLKANDEDAEYITEILQFEIDDVAQGLAFMISLIKQGNACFDAAMLQRALTVTALLQHRAKILMSSSLYLLAENLLPTLCLPRNTRLFELRGSATFCSEVLKNELDGKVSQNALDAILTTIN